MGSIKTLALKVKLAKKAKQNRPLPHFLRTIPGYKIRWNNKRRHWRRTKLNVNV
ncbi:ribosomal protein L39 [Gregarina niphandrodes]|uniref:Ribosomal protein L39 n=1 Tax=Gregarina niphandrodes TaxID=110365 RepID=A0A023B463_GRENI|nr:ribosomal protein L39 [Gregarina niphandrodes]EZG56485.1 ribosomal protein L39 [Gregarina niphandrodes]|eukprot:XP_011131260.1 ribosomal protein L39 [Gregarina niphandrodes]